MKQIKKSLALLLALMMCLSFLSFSAVAADEDLTGQIVIIHTNDTHGRDDTNFTIAGVAQLKKNYEAMGASVLLISAGDAIMGTPLVNVDFGKSAIAFMNAAGYDLMAPGNHEFDWGTENLLAILEDAEFDVLSANIFEDAELLFNPNAIYELGDLKVGVFGLTTPEAYTKAHPDKTKGLDFLMGEYMYAAAQEQVDYLQAQGCDLIVCVGHLGIDEASIPETSIDLINNVNGIDLFIDGHSHSQVDGDKIDQKDGTSTTLLVSAGQYFETVGVVLIDPANGTMDSTLLLPDDFTDRDPDVEQLVADRGAAVEEELKGVIGTTLFTLYGKNTTTPVGVRMSETNMGDFATDAMLWKARAELGDVDLALTNGGGVRDSIPTDGRLVTADEPYDITMKDMITVFPFSNTLAVVDVNGAELLEALEAAVFAAPAVNGGFPQVAGISFEIHLNVPYEQGEQYAGSTYYAPANPGARVQNVLIGGEPLDLERIYRIATNDFTAAGGDTYAVFKGKPLHNTGIGLEDVLIMYLDELGGTVSSKYASTEGRIVLKDVPTDDWAIADVTVAIELGFVPDTMLWGFKNISSRAEFAQLAVSLYEWATGVEVVPGPNPFKDTEDIYVVKAYTLGMVNGYNEDTFGPSDELNRAQAARLISNIAAVIGLPLPDEEMTFIDGDLIPDYAVEAAGQVQAAGIMIGGTDGSFGPLGLFERQQSIMTVLHFFNYFVDSMA